MATYSDDFNRADGNLGANWVESGGAGTTLIVSNQATLGYQNSCIWAAPADTDDLVAAVTQINKPSSSWGPIICAATSTPGGSDGYRLDTQDWQWSIGLIRNGVEVARSNESDFHYSELPGPFLWRIEREGADVRVYLGAMEIIVWTDPSPLTGRYVGFAGGDPAAIMDDWSGGDLSTGPTPITGTATVALDDATSAASGTVTAFIGSASVTLAPATAAGSGIYTPPPISGTASPTLADATSSATGTTTPPSFTGTAAVTLADATSTATGTYTPEPVSGAAAITLDAATSSGSGVVAGPEAIDGTANVSLAPATSTAAGTYTPGAVTGIAAVTLEAATSAAAGLVTLPPGSTVVIVSFGPATMSAPNLAAAIERRALSETTVNASALGPVEVSP